MVQCQIEYKHFPFLFTNISQSITSHSGASKALYSQSINIVNYFPFERSVKIFYYCVKSSKSSRFSTVPLSAPRQSFCFTQNPTSSVSHEHEPPTWTVKKIITVELETCSVEMWYSNLSSKSLVAFFICIWFLTDSNPAKVYSLQSSIENSKLKFFFIVFYCSVLMC